MGARPPFETFTKPTCRGSYVLGTACGRCEKCAWERVQMSAREKARDALLFSDGSLTVFPEGWPMEKIRDECRATNAGVTKGAEMTKIVSASYEILGVIWDPSTDANQVSEIDRLKAENADLRKRLGEA